MKKKSIYEELGIDPHKTSVKKAFDGIIRNDFPGAFCNIIRDPENSNYAITKHCDGSGSKSVQRYLHFSETGEGKALLEDAFDALSMNTGDVASCGFIDTYFLTDVIAVNRMNVDKQGLLYWISLGITWMIDVYRKYGIEIIFLGGETADLPAQTNSYILDMDVFARTQVDNIIKGNIQPGDKIFGFSSGGQAVWENEVNSGQMSNGLTMSRIMLMHEDCGRKYPFLTQERKPYRGRYLIDDYVKEIKTTVGKAILSPTRQWAIVIKLLIEELKKRKAFHLLHGISMNTGGGATKIKNLGQSIVYRKYMPKPLPYFQFIQKETKEDWHNMYTTFNMGIGLDIVGSDEGGVLTKAVKVVSRKTKIKFYQLGECFKNARCYQLWKNKIILETPYGRFDYED